MVYKWTPLGKALEDACQEMRFEDNKCKHIMGLFQQAIEQEFKEIKNPGNSKYSQHHKNKLNGKCDSYNNLFFVWEFKGVNFQISGADDNHQPIDGANCKIISTPHKDFEQKARPDDVRAQNKRKKKAKAK